jgi:pyrroloquinoline quinone biosynthesis protein A
VAFNDSCHVAKPVSAYYYIHVMQLFQASAVRILRKGEITMWTTPAATEMRFGFEVTMYVMNK